jgi:hypothetical protein
VTPRLKTSSQLYEIAFAAMDVASKQARVEMAAAEARVAKLKLAAELEKVGRVKEAGRVLAEIEREQAKLA